MANPEKQNDQSFLDASDEAMMEMQPPSEDELQEELIEEESDNDTEENTETTEEPADDSLEQDSSSDEVSVDPVEDTSILSQDDDTEITKEAEEVVQDTTFDDSETEEEEEKEEITVDDPVGKIDYKAEYDRIMAPFKANGKTMQLEKAEDVIQLMSMGANYNQKMRALKPNLKIMKMLDNNNLLDESKLNYLIDLDKQNPEAITKLLKDSGIDPLNVDIEEDSKYKPTAYTVNDKEVELDTVLEEIQHSSSYRETIDVISNKWDEPSKRIILDDPNIIRHINDHISEGVYGEIMTVVERERALGRLSGVPDITAYNQVGEHMQAKGMFKAQQTPPAANTNVKPIEKSKKIDPKLNKRKLAAGGTKSAPSKKGRSDFDPLALSDEEFEKLSVNDFK